MQTVASFHIFSCKKIKGIYNLIYLALLNFMIFFLLLFLKDSKFPGFSLQLRFVWLCSALFVNAFLFFISFQKCQLLCLSRTTMKFHFSSRSTIIFRFVLSLRLEGIIRTF